MQTHQREHIDKVMHTVAGGTPVPAGDSLIHDSWRRCALDFGDDGSGLFMKYLRRGSGYYIDVGACDLVANGDVKLKSGVDIARITEHSVILSDGTELPADLIVYATGYGSMNGWVERLVSPEMAAKVGKCWGLGSDTTKDPGPWEGELRNMWKPTQQEALWFHGGNAPVAPLFALPGAAAQGAHGRAGHAGLWPAGSAPHRVKPAGAAR